MKLSEAIRLGSMMKPQGFGNIFDGISTCAIGAALDANGKLDEWKERRCSPASFGTWGERWCNVYEWWCNVYTSLGISMHHKSWAVCPVCGETNLLTSIIATHLNDKHKWTREQIADWIETHVETPTAHQSSDQDQTAATR